jgi:hypothetical protein
MEEKPRDSVEKSYIRISVAPKIKRQMQNRYNNHLFHMKIIKHNITLEWYLLKNHKFSSYLKDQ